MYDETYIKKNDKLLSTFLNSDTVNRSGSDCPHALKLAACQLLYEVTAFLRETHKNLPRVRVSRAERSTSRDPDRRWSSVLTTMSNEEPPESVKLVAFVDVFVAKD